VRPSDEDLEALRGATPEEVVRALVPEGWDSDPSRTGGGVKYFDGRGNQIRVMPGFPDHRLLDHSGPYAVVSFNGKKTRILLKGNPALDEEVR
jgi:hypothetical protein